jgi:hypothetical protein
MGGPGSGSHYHWWRSSKKTTVEVCKSLDANRWMREGILKPGVCFVGSWRWVYQGGRENSITFEVDARDPVLPSLRLSYTITRRGDERGESLDYSVELTTTRPRFGGLRWWFVCPLVVNGQPCGRRVGKLYLPPGGRHFGCRHCHELTYTSCQTHDKRVDFLRKHPLELLRMEENLDSLSVAQLILLLKALPVC